MYENERKEIELLREGIAKIEVKCRHEMRQPLPVERSLMAEMRQKADQLELELPVGNPLTFQGPQARASGGNGGPFNTLGEFFQAVRTAGLPGGRTDHRLYAAATGANETTPSDGGFLVGQDLRSEILTTAFDVGKLAKLCTRYTVSSNANGIQIPGLDETSRAAGSRHGGVRSYYISEASEKTASKPKFRLIALTLKKSVVLIYATDEIIQDVSVLARYITKVAGDEIAFTMDDAIINGTGAGQPLGILNSGALVTVPKETGQAADTLVLENIVKMWSRMIGSSRQNAVWLINQNVESQLYTMSLSVGTGGSPVFLPGGAMSAQPYMTLFGRPIIPCEQCAELGDLGDIILADFKNGGVLIEKGGIQADMSIHIRFIEDESVFRFVSRWDFQPVLAAPVTPFKGGASNTQSHFVALAARD